MYFVDFSKNIFVKCWLILTYFLFTRYILCSLVVPQKKLCWNKNRVFYLFNEKPELKLCSFSFTTLFFVWESITVPILNLFKTSRRKLSRIQNTLSVRGKDSYKITNQIFRCWSRIMRINYNNNFPFRMTFFFFF